MNDAKRETFCLSLRCANLARERVRGQHNFAFQQLSFVPSHVGYRTESCLF
jgi:hypothetical protein